MNCKVNGVYKNLRYRILTINGQTYILDVGSSMWKILFPFLFWIFPAPVFKMDSQETLKKIKTPDVAQTNSGSGGFLAGGIAVLLANLTKPLVDYFDIPSSSFVNTIIVIIAVTLLLLFRFYINYKSKRNLCKIVDLNKLRKYYIWIKPNPIKHFFFITGTYLLFLIFTLMLFKAFIDLPNVMIFFITLLILLLTLFISGIFLIIGNTSVKFKRDNQKDKLF